MASDDVLEKARFYEINRNKWGDEPGANLICALAAEVRELRARAERAERVAVWAAKNGNVRIHHYRDKHKLAYFDEELNETAKIEFNGHGPDLFRALVEACEGGRDGVS